VENGDIVSRLTDLQVKPRFTRPLSKADRDIKRSFAEGLENIDDEIEREKIVSFSPNIMKTEGPINDGDVASFTYTRNCP
ncbi:MAG: hypothetical protein AAGH90_03460, partial [Pseudomonadota bacterium]